MKSNSGNTVVHGIVVAVVSAAFVFVAPGAFAWSTGHHTVARETLKLLQGEWGERLRTGDGGKVFLSAAHAPDDMKTLFSKRAEYIDETLRVRLTPQSGKEPVMYRFHEADARCELILAMSRAMRRKDEKAVGFLLACFNHSVADTVSANHSPLVHLVTYHWKALGRSEAFNDDCSMLDASPERKVVFDRVSKSICEKIPRNAPEPQSVFDAAYADELSGPDFFRLERDICVGGEASVEAFAQEAAYAVRRTVEALLAAESFFRLQEEPVFDKSLTEKRFKDRATASLSARTMGDDAIAAGVLPKPGHVPSVGVLYDPTGYWQRGMVYMVNRTLAVQIAATLRKRHDAALLDIREVMTKGVPNGVETIVAPCGGLLSRFGFTEEKLVGALTRFVARGGRLVWVGGKPKPPKELFPETVSFAKNTVREPWGFTRGPVPADEMLGGTLVTPNGRFSCMREPRGTDGWYWSQIGLAFLPDDPLPEGCREIVRFEAKDGRRVVMGYAKGRCAFVPALSVFPYIFTDTRPSVRPLVLELDDAGAAVIETALKAVLSNPGLKVGSYNILHGAVGEGTPMAWEVRKGSLVDFVGRMDMDVCGLQEVRPEQADFLTNALPQYAMVGAHRDDGRREGEASPVLYRKDRFDVVESGTFWLSETPEVPGSKSWDSACPRVCSWILLKDRTTGKAFGFANTHTDHASALARKEGMSLIMRKMRELLPAGTPLVFTGDHNCSEKDEPAQIVCKFMKNAFCASETVPVGPWRTFTEWKWIDEELSASDALKMPFAERKGHRIDYIYVSDGIHVKSFATHGDPRPGVKAYPSDHYPVTAEIEL